MSIPRKDVVYRICFVLDDWTDRKLRTEFELTGIFEGMEHELLVEFENLLVEMQQALILNDVERISQITDRQQLCLLKIVRQSKSDDAFRAEAKTYVARWMEQLAMNHKLLQQAMSINSTVLQVLYGHEASC